MKKEFKIGLVIGVVVIGVAIAVFVTRSNNSVEERALDQVAIAEPNLPLLDINAPAPMFDMNSTTALPTSTAIDDANTTSLPALPSTATTSDSTVFEQSQPIQTQRFHVIHRGDTLSSISQKYYGSVKYITKIYEANKDVIKNKNILKPGVKIVIPE